MSQDILLPIIPISSSCENNINIIILYILILDVFFQFNIYCRYTCVRIVSSPIKSEAV